MRPFIYLAAAPPWNADQSHIGRPQISFTFILPLFPKLLEFYRNVEAPLDASAPPSKTLLSSILGYLNDYKAAFARPIDSRYDIVLLGGALGSLFSWVPPPLHIACAKL